MSAAASSHQSLYAVYDERRWPLVTVKLPDAAFDEVSFADHCRRLAAYFERGEDFAFVVDSRNAAPIVAAQRRALAELLDRCARKHPSVHNYSALIIASAVQRGIVKAIAWMAGEASQTQVFASVEEGTAWCTRMLATCEPKCSSAPR